jgi:hypothetical protein
MQGRQVSNTFLCRSTSVLTLFAFLRTYGMVNTLEGEQVEKKVWDELAVLIQKMAPETAPVWDA